MRVLSDEPAALKAAGVPALCHSYGRMWQEPDFAEPARDYLIASHRSAEPGHTVALASLAREGFRPPGDLVFIAAADEEVGKSFGLEWLCEEHADAVRVDYALNEDALHLAVFDGMGHGLQATLLASVALLLFPIHADEPQLMLLMALPAIDAITAAFDA